MCPMEISIRARTARLSDACTQRTNGPVHDGAVCREPEKLGYLSRAAVSETSARPYWERRHSRASDAVRIARRPPADWWCWGPFRYCRQRRSCCRSPIRRRCAVMSPSSSVRPSCHSSGFAPKRCRWKSTAPPRPNGAEYFFIECLHPLFDVVSTPARLPAFRDREALIRASVGGTGFGTAPRIMTLAEKHPTKHRGCHAQTIAPTTQDHGPRHARVQTRGAQERARRQGRQGQEPPPGDRHRAQRGRRLEIRERAREQAAPRQVRTQGGARRDLSAGARRPVARGRARTAGEQSRHGRKERHTLDGARAQGGASARPPGQRDEGVALSACEGAGHSWPIEDEQATARERAAVRRLIPAASGPPPASISRWRWRRPRPRSGARRRRRNGGRYLLRL